MVCELLDTNLAGWLVGLEFNSPVNTVKAMSSQSVYLILLFLDRLHPLSS